MFKIKDILNIITYFCVLTGCASVLQYVTLYYSVVFVSLLILAVYLDFVRMVHFPRWLLNIVSVLVLVLCVYRIKPDYLIEPILDVLVILVGIKLIEEKKFRDYMQIYGMCLFLLMGSSLVSLSPIFLIYFLILVTFSTLSLVLLAYFSHDPQLVISKENVTRLVIQAVLICSISVPASAFFFLILPRTNYPLFSFLNQYVGSRSGFSDKVSLGDVSEIQEDGSVIFRAEMERIKENGLYWRGVVMDHFDGVSWKSSSHDHEALRYPLDGQKVSQLIYLEPYGDKFLFALDKPQALTLRRKKFQNIMTYSLREQINDRIRYNAISVVADFQPEKEIDQDRYLQLPEGFSPGIAELVRNQADGKADDEKLKALLGFLRGEDFKYSLKGLPTSKNPLDTFLFETKQGNCEYFASSLAVMLRMAAVPSRLVGGYKGGYYNKTGNYYLVLQKNAHVWVEAYLGDYNGKQGWIRVDPTPFSEQIPSVQYGESAFLQLKLLLDAFNYYWNKSVLNYDFSKQLMILNEIRSSFDRSNFKVDFKDLPVRKYIHIALGLSLLALAATGGVLWIKRKEHHQKLVANFSKRMALYGYQRRENEGLEELVARIAQEDLKSKATVFVEEFQMVFYRDKRFTRQEIRHLEDYIREL